MARCHLRITPTANPALEPTAASALRLLAVRPRSARWPRLNTNISCSLSAMTGYSDLSGSENTPAYFFSGHPRPAPRTDVGAGFVPSVLKLKPGTGLQQPRRSDSTRTRPSGQTRRIELPRDAARFEQTPFFHESLTQRKTLLLKVWQISTIACDRRTSWLSFDRAVV